MTNALDTLVGKLLTQVDGLDPNTFVIFIGDNGTPMYGRPNLDFIDNMYITQTGRGKGTPMKAVPACPWSSEGPALKPSATSNEYVHAADSIPNYVLTLAGLTAAGKEVSKRDGGLQPVDGVSLTPILFDKAATLARSEPGLPVDGIVEPDDQQYATGGSPECNL